MTVPNPKLPGAGGGSVATRGLLAQTLVALLDVAQPESCFTEITLEPAVGNEQFDFLWRNKDGSYATQVKSTINSFTKSQVEQWAGKLEAARSTENCSLMLVGNITPCLDGIEQIGAVKIEKRNLYLADLHEQAAQRLAKFLEAEGMPAGTGLRREMVGHALVSKLEHFAVKSAPLSREAFIKLFREWIGSAPKEDAKIDLSHFDVSKYAPAELIGREAETKLLNDAWLQAVRGGPKRPHILTFVALGGEGKTSLVAKWAAELAHQDWPGCEAAFAWSFYSQGTREQLAASSDLFLKEALTFFGDDAMAGSAAGAFEKGQRLAQLVGERRALLILDGVEPLQYAPASPTPGELKDQGIAALLRALAAASHSLCVVTTRYSLPDLKAFWQTTAPEVELLRLARDAGVHLLKTLGVRGTAREFESLVEGVKGHALTLTLLGSYLAEFHAGDIRKRDLVKLEQANEEIEVLQDHPHHAFNVLDAYVKQLEDASSPRPSPLSRDGGEGGRRPGEGERAKQMLALLRLLGLFDRPATTDCLGALWEKPPIPGLTEALIELDDGHRNSALKRLEAVRLLTVNRNASGALVSLDAHPLIRTYFAQQLRRSNAKAWRVGHWRLFRHLAQPAPNMSDHPDIADLQPLYQAASHGCLAGSLAEAFGIYTDRIQRRNLDILKGGFYATYQLGAFGLNLGCLLHFHQAGIALHKLGPARAAFLFQDTAFHLRALGRVNEALSFAEKAWKKLKANRLIPRRELADLAGIYANTLKIEGNLHTAMQVVEQAVALAKSSRNVPMLVHQLANQGDILHCAGQPGQAQKAFDEATRLSHPAGGPRSPGMQLWLGNDGFKYWSFLLSQGECIVVEKHIGAFLAASHQAGRDPVSRQLQEHLALALCCLGQLIILRTRSRSSPRMQQARRSLQESASLLRKFSGLDLLPHALMALAHCLKVLGKARDSVNLLNEAWEIAERGPMRLFLADIHLYRARLFFREKNYPWESPAADLAAARKLINECGYHRRDEELADAKGAILGT